MTKKVRLDRFNVLEASEFFRNNGMNVYGQETLTDLYSRGDETDFPNIWFEELEAKLVKNGDLRAVRKISGRYCVKKKLEDARSRHEIEFECLGDERMRVVSEGPYRLRYRKVTD